MNTRSRLTTAFIVSLFLVTIFLTGTASAKSLYAIASINQSPSPINAYNINADGTLAPPVTHLVPARALGAVGISAYIDRDALGVPTGEGTLFITYESSNEIQLVDAATMTGDPGDTVSAPGASNLAGIVYDRTKEKVYTVDRNTNHLYVYTYDPVMVTLTLDEGTYVPLPNVSGAHGLALDVENGLLYVGDLTETVKVFSTDDWSFAREFTVSQAVMGIALDLKGGFVYTGNAYPGFGSLGLLCKYDLNTNTETTLNISTITGVADNVVGLAVDNTLGDAPNLVYISTGDQGYGGSDRIIALDPDFNVVDSTGDIGDPTGIFIPEEEVGFNPLNLSKSDNLDPVTAGSNLTYTICFDNEENQTAITDVTITDPIPLGTAFVSATGPYTLDNGNIVWEFGEVEGGAGQECVDLVVNVTAEPGTSIINTCTIEGAETGPTTQTIDTTVEEAEEGLLICLSPASDLNIVGEDHTVTATVTDQSGRPEAGISVTFEVISGPNAGISGNSATDTSGEASFSYTGDGGVGTDEIQACLVDWTGEEVCSEVVTKDWEEDEYELMECFITSGLLFKTRQGRKDALSGWGRFWLAEDQDVDPLREDVQFDIDGYSVFIPAGSFQFVAPYYFLFSGTNEDGALVSAVILLKGNKKGRWWLDIKKDEIAGDICCLDNSDGVDVSLLIDTDLGTENIVMSGQTSTILYYLNRGSTCEETIK